MKTTRFTEEQIAYAVRLTEGGMPVADMCRQIGISDAQGRMTAWHQAFAVLLLRRALAFCLTAAASQG